MAKKTIPSVRLAGTQKPLSGAAKARPKDIIATDARKHLPSTTAGKNRRSGLCT
jgi:hypothetical protein